MKFKSILVISLTAIIFTGCSSPQKITLKDNTVIETKNEATYNKKTGFYEYKDINGRNNNINSSVIFKIEDLK